MSHRLPIMLVAAGTIVAILGTAAFGQPNERSASPTAQQAAAGQLAATQRGPRGRRGPRGPRGFRGLRGLTGATGATGAPGSPGPAGATGQTGAPGQNGTQGPPGLSGVEVIQADGPTITSGVQSSTATASCSAGKKIIGGAVEPIIIPGFSFVTGPFVDASRPVTTEPQGWTGTIRASGSEDWFARAYAICANAT
jgi:hypothetical protein